MEVDCVLCYFADGVESLIIPMVRRRTKDMKVGVRKSALQALEAIIRLDLNSINKEVRKYEMSCVSFVVCVCVCSGCDGCTRAVYGSCTISKEAGSCLPLLPHHRRPSLHSTP